MGSYAFKANLLAYHLLLLSALKMAYPTFNLESYTLSKSWSMMLIYFCTNNQHLIHYLQSNIKKKKSSKGSLQAGTISIAMVFFHYSLDISLHQRTHFTLGFHLYSVLVLLIMQSWYTQTIIMYLTASALGICYIGLLLTIRPQTQKMKRDC